MKQKTQEMREANVAFPSCAALTTQSPQKIKQEQQQQTPSFLNNSHNRPQHSRLIHRLDKRRYASLHPRSFPDWCHVACIVASRSRTVSHIIQPSAVSQHDRRSLLKTPPQALQFQHWKQRHQRHQEGHSQSPSCCGR